MFNYSNIRPCKKYESSSHWIFSEIEIVIENNLNFIPIDLAIGNIVGIFLIANISSLKSVPNKVGVNSIEFTLQEWNFKWTKDLQILSDNAKGFGSVPNLSDFELN